MFKAVRGRTCRPDRSALDHPSGSGWHGIIAGCDGSGVGFPPKPNPQFHGYEVPNRAGPRRVIPHYFESFRHVCHVVAFMCSNGDLATSTLTAHSSRCESKTGNNGVQDGLGTRSRPASGNGQPQERAGQQPVGAWRARPRFR